MSATDIVYIIGTAGIVIFFIVFVVGLFADEIVKIIRSIRGDDD